MCYDLKLKPYVCNLCFNLPKVEGYLNTFIVHTTVATIVNYDCNKFVVQPTVATIVNYDCNKFIGHMSSYITCLFPKHV